MTELAVFDVAGAQHLLVTVGNNYHAVRRATSEHHEDYATWSPRTVCGRAWWIPSDADGDPLAGWPPAVAPTCQACLRNLTRGLDETPLDERVARLAAAMIASVHKYGSAQCDGVPGDQAERLRNSVKSQVRKQAGRVETFSRSGFVVIADHDHPGHPEVDAAMRDALDSIFPVLGTGHTESEVRSGPPRRPWLFHWSDW